MSISQMRISEAEIALADGYPYRPYVEFICLTTGLSFYLRNSFVNKIPFVSIPIIGGSILMSRFIVKHFSEQNLVPVINYEKDRLESEKIYLKSFTAKLEERANYLRKKSQQSKEESVKLV